AGVAAAAGTAHLRRGCVRFPPHPGAGRADVAWPQGARPLEVQAVRHKPAGAARLARWLLKHQPQRRPGCELPRRSHAGWAKAPEARCIMLCEVELVEYTDEIRNGIYGRPREWPHNRLLLVDRILKAMLLAQPEEDAGEPDDQWSCLRRRLC